MTNDSEELMQKIIKIHRKIKTRQFKSIQDGLRMITLETEMLRCLMMEISNDLLTRNDRFFK